LPMNSAIACGPVGGVDAEAAAAAFKEERRARN